MAALTPQPDLPPELAQLAGAGPPPGAPRSIQVPGGPPLGPGPGGPPPELLGAAGPDRDDELGLLDEIRQLCLDYIQIASDDVEKSKMTQALKIVQDLFASNQKAQEAGSGTTPQMKGMARAIQRGAA